MKLLLYILLMNTSALGWQEHDSIPELNKHVVQYVNSVIGQQVDRGECWDLAYQALTRIDAQWDGMFVYGEEIDYLSEPVYPGDIIQFKDVVIREVEGLVTRTSTMVQHTAIVYRVHEAGKYDLAHQNTGFSGRKVGVNTVNLNAMVEGSVKVYRPTK